MSLNLLKYNTVVILLVLLVFSHATLKLLSPFPFDSQAIFHLTLTLIAIIGLSLYGFLIDEKYFKNNKNLLNYKILLSTTEMITFIYMGIIFLEIWQWSNNNEMPRYQGGNPKAGIIFLIFKLVRSVEVYWWGIIFLSIGVIFFFIARKNIELLKKSFIFTKKEELNIPKNIVQEIKDETPSQSLNETMYKIYEKRIASQDIYEHDIPNFSLQNAEIIGEYLTVHYFFDSIQQSKYILEQGLQKYSAMDSIFASSKWFESDNLNGLGHDLGRYFYSLYKENDILMKCLQNGLKIRYVITTQNLEKKIIIISDNIFTKENFSSYWDLYKE